MGVDGVNLTTDSVNGITKGSLSRIVLTDGRFQLKSCIDPSVGRFVLAATNHPERIDKAVLRTGRIDEMVYIDMPDKEARKSLFSLALSKLPSDEGIDINRLAELTEGYNCSDIIYIVRSAARKMFNATIKGCTDEYQPISQTLLEEVISKKRPSVSGRDLREYERVRSEFSPKDDGCRHATIGFR